MGIGRSGVVTPGSVALLTLTSAIVVTAAVVVVLPPTTVMVPIPVGPASATTSASPDAQGFLPLERRLWQRLGPAVFTTCTPRPAIENADRPAVLNCVPADPGTGRSPLVTQFASRDALIEHLSQRRAATTDEGACADAVSDTTTWFSGNDTGDIKGSMICDWNGANFRIEWTYDALNISVIAEGTDAAALWAWWKRVANHLITVAF